MVVLYRVCDYLILPLISSFFFEEIPILGVHAKDEHDRTVFLRDFSHGSGVARSAA